MVNENKKIEFKQIVIEYRNGNKDILNELFWTNPITRQFKYNIPQFRKKVSVLKGLYADLWQSDEIEMMFFEVLLELIIDEKNKFPIIKDDGSERTSTQLINWFLTVIDYRFIELSNSLADEKRQTIYSDSVIVDDYAGEEEEMNLFEDSIISDWNKQPLHDTFRDFLERIDFRKSLTERQLETLEYLLEYYGKIDEPLSKNKLSYAKIGKMMNISAQAVKDIEERISNKVLQLFQYWQGTQPKKVLLSIRIKEILKAHGIMMNQTKDENAIYQNFLVLLKINEVSELTDLLCDKLSLRDWTTLEKWLESGIIHKGKMKSLVKNCVKVFAGYLERQDKYVNQMAQWLSTYNRNQQYAVFRKHSENTYFQNKKAE